MKKVISSLFALALVCLMFTNCSASPKTKSPPPGQPMDDRNIDYTHLSAKERSFIRTTTADFLVEYLTQTASESAEAREERLAPFIAPSFYTVDRALFEGAPQEEIPPIPSTYSSQYVSIEKSRVDRPDPDTIFWTIEETPPKEGFALLTTTVTTYFTDEEGFEDREDRVWIIIFQKIGEEWLVNSLRKGPLISSAVE